MDVFAYTAGILTLPVIAGLVSSITWLLSKNFGSWCGRCGRIHGEIGENFRIATKARARMHRCSKETDRG